jgi:hypothetical protein
MKPVKKINKVLRKVQNKFNNSEVYYTYSHWETKEIDGVAFLPVVKINPEENRNTSIIHFLRKDSVEYIK